MSTSQKHRLFMAEPIGSKRVTDLPGIGMVFGRRLEDKHFTHAYMVLGHYLLLRKNDEMFMSWLHETCGANTKHQSDCCDCLKKWCQRYL